MWKLFNGDTILDNFKTFIVSDLKIYRLMTSCAGGFCKHGCILCTCLFTIRKEETDAGIDIWDEGDLRGDSSAWKHGCKGCTRLQFRSCYTTWPTFKN